MSSNSQSAKASSAPRIVADIGGTNGRFAIVRDGRITARREYRNAEFSDLASLIKRYLEDAGSADDDVEAACLAVAAPVSENGEARFTNAPWKVSASKLQKTMKLARVAIINDFAAQAYGLDTLGASDAEPIVARMKGRDGSVSNSVSHAATRRARVVLGPGTGLGCAALVPDVEGRNQPVAVTSEGGHMGFAAETGDDRKILDAARKKYGHASWERVCCGSGLALVHVALWPDENVKGVKDSDPSEVVRLAQADRSSHAARSVRQFCGMLGAFAGDLALVFNASGGVYLTGGVLGHLADAFDADAFMQRFLDKGRYRDWLASLPVLRITVDDCALRGCARYLERAEDSRACP